MTTNETGEKREFLNRLVRGHQHVRESVKDEWYCETCEVHVAYCSEWADDLGEPDAPGRIEAMVAAHHRERNRLFHGRSGWR